MSENEISEVVEYLKWKQKKIHYFLLAVERGTILKEKDDFFMNMELEQLDNYFEELDFLER